MQSKMINLDIKIDLDSFTQRFYSDFNLYESILFHILTNAIKFTPTGSKVCLEVRFESLKNEEIKQEDAN